MFATFWRQQFKSVYLLGSADCRMSVKQYIMEYGCDCVDDNQITTVGSVTQITTALNLWKSVIPG